METLGDIISAATEANQSNGVVNRHEALNTAIEQVKSNPDLADQCIRADLGRRIKERAIRVARNAGDRSNRQMSMFGLRAAYALDDEAHNVKDTDALTRSEFEALINLRQRQVTADLGHLSKLRDAMRHTASIWNRHPDWTWGQVEAEYANRQARAA
jgi:hypothetical protein